MAGRLLNTELKEFDATTLDGTYQNLGSVLSNPALKVMFLNTSDVDAYISVDGATNKLRLPSGSALTFDETTFKMPNKDQEYYLAVGTQLTVTQVTGAGTSGNIIAHLVTRTL
jgi:hypothetical protein